MLRELPRLDILWLTLIYNAILQLGMFPTAWKSAKIIMLSKAGKNQSELKSYRPISMLSVLSKAFEKLLHCRLLDILPPTALPEHQFSFRAHHSTVDQIQIVTSTILSSLERKEFCAAALLEVSQAFDHIWHEGLMVKLSRLLPWNICLLLRNYLSNCSFFVIYGEHSSSPRPTTAGVPQRSVIGPLLYTLYTTDLPTPPDTTVASFADDTAILSSSDYLKAVAVLQEALDTIHQWLSTWKILFNCEKSTKKVVLSEKTLKNQFVGGHSRFEGREHLAIKINITFFVGIDVLNIFYLTTFSKKTIFSKI